MRIIVSLYKVSTPHPLPPPVADTMMMIKMIKTTTPMIIIILMFCHQYFLLSLVA